MRASAASIRSSLIGAILVLATAGCDSPLDPDPLLWAGTLVAGADHPEITGSVAMFAGPTETQIGIGVQGAPEEARLGWRVRTGRCGAAGLGVASPGSFPAIAVDGAGSGKADALVRRRLAADEQYAAEVYADATGSTQVIACAELERT